MRALSLFSGIGLHDLGLERAGWEIAGQVEIDPWCREVLAKHWPSVQRWEDVRDVTAESLSGLGRIELVTGGFPCQDTSSAGRGVGIKRGERSSLWSQMLRIIKLVLPSFVLAENVPNLFSRGIDTVLAGLEEAGYAAWPVVVGAWAVGAPHRRDRVWIVGRRLENAQGGGRRASGAEEPEEARADASSRHAGSRVGQPNHGDAARLLPGPGEDQGEIVGRSQAGASGRRTREAGGTRVGDANSPRREGSWTEAYEGRPGSGDGCDGRMADPDGGALRLESGRIGGEGRTGEAEPRDAGEGLAHSEGLGLEGSGPAGLAPSVRRRIAHGPAPVVANPNGGGQRADGGEIGNAGHAHLRWPARRGEPQHPWEPPRLTQSGLGRGFNGRAARLDGFARRNRLKALGNANPWQVPYLIGRWMLENAATPEPD